jgi:adenylate cyclase
MERRLAAILAADVANYTRIMEQGEEASLHVLRSYFEVIRQVITAHRGHIFSTAGDSVVAEFPSIVEAIRAALEIQGELVERNAALPENRRMLFRMGVNLGDVISDQDNLYGTGVNVAARLEEIAEPGGICISRMAFEQVRKIVEIRFEDMGERRLKNISEPIRVYRLIPSALGTHGSILSGSRRRRIVGIGALAIALVAAAAILVHPDALAALLRAMGFKTETAEAVPEHPSIAVLPFEDLSAGGDQRYLAEGIAEEIITGLAKFPDLVVIARSATFTYEDQDVDVKKVGTELNVSYVVEGSIQRSDRDVRITAQLIDARSRRQIWVDRYDRQVSSIFAIRDDISRSVAGALMTTSGKLATAEIARLATKDPKNFTAYDYLMRGWFEWHKFTRESNQAARDLFEKAKASDPTYARAYAGLAWTYAMDYDLGWTEDYDGAVKKALDLATEAVQLDGTDYRSHWVLGWAYLYSWDHERAVASYNRALQLNANDAELLAEMGNLLIYIGKPQQAIDQIKDGIRLNPFHDDWYLEYLGWAYEEAGMPVEAIATLEQVVKENPDEEQSWVLPFMAAAYADPKVGKPEKSKKLGAKILELEPTFTISSLIERSPYQTEEQKTRVRERLRLAGLPE